MTEATEVEKLTLRLRQVERSAGKLADELGETRRRERDTARELRRWVERALKAEAAVKSTGMGSEG